MNNDGLIVCECLESMVKKVWVKTRKFKRLNFWADCGPHFRNQEVAAFLLRTVFKLMPTVEQVDVNYFWESHGKNCNDSHFSLVSRLFEQIENQMHVRDTQTMIQ